LHFGGSSQAVLLKGSEGGILFLWTPPPPPEIFTSVNFILRQNAIRVYKAVCHIGRCHHTKWRLISRLRLTKFYTVVLLGGA